MTTRTNAKTPTSADHKHSHALKAVDAQLAALNDALRALDARVAALEVPAPPPPPDPPAIGSYDELVAAIAAAAPGGVVDCDGETFAVPDAGLLLDRSITLRNAHLTSTRKSGSASNGVVRVTADGASLEAVAVDGGFVGIVLDGAADVRVVGCDVRDTVYAGIMGLSALDCEITACVVNGVRPIDGANGHNAYGIALSNRAGRPVSARVDVHGNVVRNVPTWHGLDTHGGSDITFRDNVVIACRRGIFLTDAPARVVCTGNRLTAPTAAEQAQTPPGGAPPTYLSDIRGISVVGGSGEIRDNTGIGYPASRWWNPISPGSYVFSGNDPVIP